MLSLHFLQLHFILCLSPWVSWVTHTLPVFSLHTCHFYRLYSLIWTWITPQPTILVICFFHFSPFSLASGFFALPFYILPELFHTQIAFISSTENSSNLSFSDFRMWFRKNLSWMDSLNSRLWLNRSAYKFDLWKSNTSNKPVLGIIWVLLSRIRIIFTGKKYSLFWLFTHLLLV